MMYTVAITHHVNNGLGWEASSLEVAEYFEVATRKQAQEIINAKMTAGRLANVYVVDNDGSADLIANTSIGNPKLGWVF